MMLRLLMLLDFDSLLVNEQCRNCQVCIVMVIYEHAKTFGIIEIIC